MNKEELISKLQMVYVGDRNALNEMIGYYDGLKEVIEMIQQENQQLKEKCEKQQFAIVENCDLRLEIEQLKQIEKEHQKINGELREEIK